MKAWHYEAAFLRASGHEWTEIAAILGKSYDALMSIQRNPEFQAEVERCRLIITEAKAEREADDPALAELRAAAADAARALAELVRGARSENARARAAEAILDRAGYKPVERVEATQRVVLTGKDAENLIAALAAMRAERDEADVEPGD